MTDRPTKLTADQKRLAAEAVASVRLDEGDYGTRVETPAERDSFDSADGQTHYSPEDEAKALAALVHGGPETVEGVGRMASVVVSDAEMRAIRGGGVGIRPIPFGMEPLGFTLTQPLGVADPNFAKSDGVTVPAGTVYPFAVDTVVGDGGPVTESVIIAAFRSVEAVLAQLPEGKHKERALDGLAWVKDEAILSARGRE